MCCTYSGDPTFCNGRCGTITKLDNCGVQRTVNCACANGQECAKNGVCCSYSGDNVFCGGACGSLTKADNCGVVRTVDCPNGCAFGLVCHGNACCAPEGDQALCYSGFLCGCSNDVDCRDPRADRCGPVGNTMACVCGNGFSVCPSGQTCTNGACL